MQCIDPGNGLERQIDEARAGDIDLLDKAVGAKFLGDRFGKFARFTLGIFRQHHRRVGRDVAVSRIARRLDRDARLIDAGRQYAVGYQVVVRAANANQHVGENVLLLS